MRRDRKRCPDGGAARTGRERRTHAAGTLLRRASFPCLLAFCLTLAGCGAASDAKYTGSAMDTGAADMLSAPMPDEAALENGAPETASFAVTEPEAAEDVAAAAGGAEAASVSQQAKSGRKLIRQVQISAQTRRYDDCLAALTDRIAVCGGYLEASDHYGGGGDRRWCTLTARIPAEQLDGFLTQVSELCVVVQRSESTRDMTLQYVDLDSHKKSLQTEQERLMALMEQAQTVEDLIALEERLAQVRYELESMEAQLRAIDNQVSYSTVTVTLEEVERETPAPEHPGALERMKTGFLENLYAVGDGLRELGIWLIVHLPVLTVWGAALALAGWALRVIVRRRKRHAAGAGTKTRGKKTAAQGAAQSPQGAETTASGAETGRDDRSGQQEETR